MRASVHNSASNVNDVTRAKSKVDLTGTAAVGGLSEVDVDSTMGTKGTRAILAPFKLMKEESPP